VVQVETSFCKSWRGLGGGAGPFWLHKETLTFMGPAAYQNTAVFQIGVNKIPPNFDTLFATSLLVIRQFKGLTYVMSL
jgi:hypothetical protein